MFSSSAAVKGNVDSDGERDDDKDLDGFYGDDDADSTDIYLNRNWKDDDWDKDGDGD